MQELENATIAAKQEKRKLKIRINKKVQPEAAGQSGQKWEVMKMKFVLLLSNRAEISNKSRGTEIGKMVWTAMFDALGEIYETENKTSA